MSGVRWTESSECRELMEELHKAVGMTLLAQLKAGDVKAFTLQVAVQFLKNNGIDVSSLTTPGETADALADLMSSLPDFGEDEKLSFARSE